ncbi:MAG: hypothetical protein ACLTER_00335 [Ruminococcus sp.]
MADGTLTIYTETDEKGIKVGMKGNRGFCQAHVFLCGRSWGKG